MKTASRSAAAVSIGSRLVVGLAVGSFFAWVAWRAVTPAWVRLLLEAGMPFVWAVTVGVLVGPVLMVGAGVGWAFWGGK